MPTLRWNIPEPQGSNRYVTCTSSNNLTEPCFACNASHFRLILEMTGALQVIQFSLLTFLLIFLQLTWQATSTQTTRKSSAASVRRFSPTTCFCTDTGTGWESCGLPPSRGNGLRSQPCYTLLHLIRGVVARVQTFLWYNKLDKVVDVFRIVKILNEP